MQLRTILQHCLRMNSWKAIGAARLGLTGLIFNLETCFMVQRLSSLLLFSNKCQFLDFVSALKFIIFFIVKKEATHAQSQG